MFLESTTAPPPRKRRVAEGGPCPHGNVGAGDQPVWEPGSNCNLNITVGNFSSIFYGLCRPLLVPRLHRVNCTPPPFTQAQLHAHPKITLFSYHWLNYTQSHKMIPSSLCLCLYLPWGRIRIRTGFNSDPDPAFRSMRIRVQFRIRIRIQSCDDQKL